MRVPFLDLGRMHQEIRVPLESAFQRVMDSGLFIMGPEVAVLHTAIMRKLGFECLLGK